jgi:hypothetical protein
MAPNSGVVDISAKKAWYRWGG